MIKDLRKVNAVEVIEEGTDEHFEIAEWQKNIVLARLAESQEFPEELISLKNAEERFRKLRG